MITLMRLVVHKAVAKKVRVHHQKVRVLIVMTPPTQAYLSVQVQIYIMIHHLQVVDKLMKIVLIILQHLVVSLLKFHLHLQMMRNTPLLLVGKHPQDMNQHRLLKKHLQRVLQVNHRLLKKHLQRVLQVNQHQLLLLLLLLNYS